MQAASQVAAEEVVYDEAKSKPDKRLDMVQWFAAFEVEALLAAIGGFSFAFACSGLGTRLRGHWNFGILSGEITSEDLHSDRL